MSLHSAPKNLFVAGNLSVCVIILVLLILFHRTDDEVRVSLSVARSEQNSAEGSPVGATAGNPVPPLSQQGRQDDLESQASPVPGEGDDWLVVARENLSVFATESLSGIMHVNAVLEYMIEFASLSVEGHIDFDYEDDDAIAYAIKGLPEGMTGHFLVGFQPYIENGKTHRYLQMSINAHPAEQEYIDGAMRDGPNINLSESYDADDPGAPTRFALMLQRRVDLSASRKVGIDPYSGEYTYGAYYWHDMLDKSKAPLTTTLGLVNGNPVDVDSFAGVSPLAGDVLLDPDLLHELLAKLQKNLALLHL
ncbi:MAG: hypothetical protein H0U74_07255 [Bradymonadaceae bacterium]|nr:hypothetical protein [Lujinxingiaceae bacterium]